MATTTICGMLSGAFAVSALAPTAAFAQDAAPAAAPAPADDTTTVIVTGSILRKKNLTSISPLTVLSSADLEKRGVTTVESAVQNLAGNNGGAISNNWSTNGFSYGASGLSLRGLTSNSTLVLVDGMRLAYYPLADDATRNFVDLNTIPDSIIDRVDVLQDGASASYGADAIAGVVNIVTKRQFTGFSGRASVGAPEHAGAGQIGLAGTWGKGSLAEDGYNFYVSGEYQHDEALMAKDAGYPYNTADRSGHCGKSVNAPGSVGVNDAGITCRTNGIVNGIQFDDTFAGAGSTTVAEVRAYNAANTAPAAVSPWQLLNPALGCGSLNKITITANQGRRLSAANKAADIGQDFCQMDTTKLYNYIQPEITRESLSGRFTKRFSDSSEFYAEANIYQNEVYLAGGPRNIQGSATPGEAGTNGSTVGIALPVYVCLTPGSHAVCTATNGKLNDQNPYAGAGQVARINYLFGDIPFTTRSKSVSYRFASGFKGEALGWDYNIDFTANKTTLVYTQTGRLYAQHVYDVVNDGTYNFMDPSKNTAAIRNYVSPTVVQHSDSELVQGQVSVSRPLFDLGGGPLVLGLGAAWRYERVKNPSANPDPLGGDPLQRYETVNPFGAIGFRHVSSASFELEAPFTSRLLVNLAGRVDDYSTGFSAFSPKLSASYKLLDSLTFRGTFSKGFRAPSIAETNSDPSTGFVTPTLSTSDPAEAAFIAAHEGNAYATNAYSLGLTSVAAKDLKPEKSEGQTLGIVWQPTSYLGFSADWYKIHKDGIIAGADYAPAIEAYFAGQAIPAGFTVLPGAVDPDHPTALPLPGFVKYSLLNLNTQETSGMDFSVTGRFNLGNVKWTTNLDATYIQYYFQTYPDGTKQQYAGTLGNNQITSGSGTPKLRGNFTNSFDFGKFNVSATAYYIDGYKSIATDSGDDFYGPCEGSSTAAVYRDSTTVVKCNVDSFVDVDLHASYKLTEHYTVMLDVTNLLSTNAPYDPSGTYQLSLYNPAFTQQGMMGRYWKLTAKATF